MTKKEKKELNPQITESKNNIDEEKLKTIAESLNKSIIFDKNQNSDSDSYFRAVLDKLFSSENISQKTEYIGIAENFHGAKLTFLGKYCNVPLLEKFIEVFEEKRVSLERKGRKEILIALENRQQEIDKDKLNNMAKMFNM